MAYGHQHMNPPSGPATMIPAFVILGFLSLVLAGGAQEWFQHGNKLYGWGALLGFVAIWTFLIFVLTLHIRAGRLWGWYCQTGRIPEFKKHGFWKGAMLGALLGVGVLALAMMASVGASEESYGAASWFAYAVVYGGMFFFPAIVVPAVVCGWAKRAWDRTAIPGPIQNVSGPGGSGWKNLR